MLDAYLQNCITLIKNNSCKRSIMDIVDTTHIYKYMATHLSSIFSKHFEKDVWKVVNLCAFILD